MFYSTLRQQHQEKRYQLLILDWRLYILFLAEQMNRIAWWAVQCELLDRVLPAQRALSQGHFLKIFFVYDALRAQLRDVLLFFAFDNVSHGDYFVTRVWKLPLLVAFVFQIDTFPLFFDLYAFSWNVSEEISALTLKLIFAHRGWSNLNSYWFFWL